MSANDKQVAGQHYKTKIECWDYVHSNGIGYLDGNVIKYVSRFRRKGGLQDLYKAQHYLEKLIEEYQRETEEAEELQFQKEIAEARRRDGV